MAICSLFAINWRTEIPIPIVSDYFKGWQGHCSPRYQTDMSESVTDYQSDIVDRHLGLSVREGVRESVRWPGGRNLRFSQLNNIMQYNLSLTDSLGCLHCEDPLSNGNIRVSYMLYRKNDFFQSPSEMSGSSKYETANSAVVSAAIGGLKLDHLSDPIRTVFKPREVSQTRTESNALFLLVWIWNVQFLRPCNW